MNKLYAVLFAITASLTVSTVAHANTDKLAGTTQNNLYGQTRIVGGEPALEGAWPWMSALVFTFSEVDTDLTVDGSRYLTSAFTGSPAGSATGSLIDCGLGDAPCLDVQDKICLIERGEINFSDKALNCEAGGGVGVVIYNNESGQIAGTLGDNFNGTIAVVGISQQDGQSLLAVLPKTASLRVSSALNTLQDSTCGATFLGGKWVLTAAHCLDSSNAMRLKVNVGEYDLADGAQNAIGIANIYIHGDFDDETINNDIALIELLNDVNAPAVQIASTQLTTQLAIEHSMATVIGWGGRVGYAPGEGPTSDFSDTLHQVDLNLSTNEECRDILAGSLHTSAQNTGVTDVMICASAPVSGKGSCQGDSGGPLLVDTNTGPQQVGIVSWGFGCADAAYPGVFTRVSEFSNWINAISKGIAISQKQDFGIVPAGVSQTANLTLSNHSDKIANLTFNIEGNSVFRVTGDNCNELSPGQSCELSVAYQPSSAGEFNAYLMVSADDPEIATSRAKLTGIALGSANGLEGVAGPSNAAVRWYSGGAKVWSSHSVSGVQSGQITGLQDSILMAVIQGKGELTFEWSVSSEENLDDPNDPFDALYLLINGEQIDFISGEKEGVYSAQNYALGNGQNIVSWVYSKDANSEEGEDAGFVRSVSFEPEVTFLPVPIKPRRSSGGSMGWLSLMMFGLLFCRRKE